MIPVEILSLISFLNSFYQLNVFEHGKEATKLASQIQLTDNDMAWTKANYKISEDNLSSHAPHSNKNLNYLILIKMYEDVRLNFPKY